MQLYYGGCLWRKRRPLAGICALWHKGLSELALAALDDRNGCLPVTHGMIARGTDRDMTMWRTVELETIARWDYFSLAHQRHSQQ
jgi:L-fuculose-phosphate aldolase